MYLLPKLIALQLLLLCAATKAEDPWSFTVKGAFLSEPRHYVAEENATVEFITTYVGDSKTSYKFIHGNEYLQNQTVTRKPFQQFIDGVYLPDIFTATLRFTAHKNMRLETFLTPDAYAKLNRKGLAKHMFKKFTVQFVNGPEISLVGENIKSVDDNGGYSFMENEQFSLNCSAGGLANTTIEWVDRAGNTVIPSQVTELGPLTEMPSSKNEFYPSFQILKVSALREMTSFGCRMKAPNYKSSPFEHTNWFKFTVESNDVLLVEDTLADVDVKVDVEVKSSLKFS